MSNNNYVNCHWLGQYTYTTLPHEFYSLETVCPVKNPQLVFYNEQLSTALNLDCRDPAILSGTWMPQEKQPIALAYGGHQFGHFTILGDGRAKLLGEITAQDGQLYDLQVKGSGQTAYSRGGDGKSTFVAALREYLVSEALAGLGIPTTKSLALLKTDDTVMRQKPYQQGMVVRVAKSHLRVGTFQFAALLGESHLAALLDYAVKRHYPLASNSVQSETTYAKPKTELALYFLRQAVKAQALLIAQWQSAGFIHGVMNTDNMTISGETIDFGPCAFLDEYIPDTHFSSIDTSGRYAYQNQPKIAQWNLARLADSLIPLVSGSKIVRIEKLNNVLMEFEDAYSTEWTRLMANRLGIEHPVASDHGLIQGFLQLLEKDQQDYHESFHQFYLGNPPYASAEWLSWHEQWKQRIKNVQEAVSLIQKTAPQSIARNYYIEDSLAAAEQGSMQKATALLTALQNPFAHIPNNPYSKIPPKWDGEYKTFCGT